MNKFDFVFIIAGNLPLPIITFILIAVICMYKFLANEKLIYNINWQSD